MKQFTCEYNIDTACVELRRGSTMILAVDCIAVEDQLARNLYERSALDYLIYNDPIGYAELVMEGNPQAYLKAIGNYHGLNVLG